MADISTEELTREIHAILKTADLSVVSAKKVREQVENKLNCSLATRKKEFDRIVMDFINSQHEEEEEEGEDDDSDQENDKDGSADEDEASSEEDRRPAVKRSAPSINRKSAAPKKKKKSINASDSGTESDGGDDSDFEVSKKKKGGAAKKKKAAGAGGARKSTGFTRAYQLSPELSTLMGADSLPRHEVVKKVWAIIKERNLYDPKNKQYAICDDELMNVMKVKRFRTFGMLKHLKPHFLE